MTKRISLAGFIHMECANFVGSGCIMLKGHGCLPTERGRRCGYFEFSVLPLAKDFPEYLAAVDEYDKVAGGRIKGIYVRRCECGEPLGSRRRLCDGCQAARRKVTYRDSQRNRRLSTVNGFLGQGAQ